MISTGGTTDRDPSELAALQGATCATNAPGLAGLAPEARRPDLAFHFEWCRGVRRTGTRPTTSSSGAPPIARSACEISDERWSRDAAAGARATIIAGAQARHDGHTGARLGCSRLGELATRIGSSLPTTYEFMRDSTDDGVVCA